MEEDKMSTQAARQAAKEEFEDQKKRLAAKMEIVNFYGGCCKSFDRMTAAQNKELMKKLRGGSDPEPLDAVVGQFAEEREAQIKEWAKKAENSKGVKRRYAKLTQFCDGGSKAFGLPVS